MNEASGGDRITAELFKILKGGAVKVLHSICHFFFLAYFTLYNRLQFHPPH